MKVIDRKLLTMAIMKDCVTAWQAYWKIFSDPWRKWKSGKEIKVAVIDTGIEQSLLSERMKNSIIAARDFTGRRTTISTEARQLHGTLCADIIFSTAKGCQLIDCCVTHTTELSFKPLAVAIEWAARECQADVINISVGTIGLSGLYTIKRACQIAEKEGAIVISACANSGNTSLPSALPMVISVSGIDLGQKGRWCCSARRDKQIYAHSGPYIPRNIVLRSLEAMKGNSAAAAAASGQMARLLGTINNRERRHIERAFFSSAAAIIS